MTFRYVARCLDGLVGAHMEKLCIFAKNKDLLLKFRSGASAAAIPHAEWEEPEYVCQSQCMLNVKRLLLFKLHATVSGRKFSIYDSLVIDPNPTEENWLSQSREWAIIWKFWKISRSIQQHHSFPKQDFHRIRVIWRKEFAPLFASHIGCSWTWKYNF